MPHSSKSTEEKELAIDTIDDLREFLGYAHDILSELEMGVGALPSPQLGAPFMAEAKDVFDRLEALVLQYVRIIDLGGYLGDQHTDAMQQLYNELLMLQEDLIVAMEYIPSTESLAVRHLYGEKESVSSARRQGAEVPVTVESDTSSRSISVRSHAFDSEAIRSHLVHIKKRAQTLYNDLADILEEYNALTRVTDPLYAPAIALYQSCEAGARMVAAYIAKLDGAVAAPITEGSAELLPEGEVLFEAAREYLARATQELPAYFVADEEEHIEEISPEVVPTVQKTVDTFRQSLFAKNELRPFIDAALAVPGNTTHVSQYFSSPSAFEAYLNRDIAEREKPSKFEKVFGIKHQSPFHTLLRDLTLAEVEHLDQLPPTDIRAIVAELDIQYEQYVAWVDAYEVMKDYVQPLPSISFGEFYVRAMIEELKIRYGA